MISLHLSTRIYMGYCYFVSWRGIMSQWSVAGLVEVVQD